MLDLFGLNIQAVPNTHISLYTRDERGRVYPFGNLKITPNGKVVASFGKDILPSGKKVIV